jgi:hypothetical protein
MKTAILTAAMMILMATATSAGSYKNIDNPGSPVKTEFKAAIVQPSAHFIHFSVANPSSDKVVMKIYNDKNVKVFHRRTKNEKEWSIRCDMRNAESGIYTCVVERNGKEELCKQFIIMN